MNSLNKVRGRWSVVIEVDRSEPIDGLLKSLIERNLWFPVEMLLCQRDVRLATGWIVWR